MTINVGLSKMIMLGKHEVAHKMLAERGAQFSTRPPLTMANDFITRGFHIAAMPHGPRWKEESRAMTAVLNPKASQAYEPVYDYQSKLLLWEILSTHGFTGTPIPLSSLWPTGFRFNRMSRSWPTHPEWSRSGGKPSPPASRRWISFLSCGIYRGASPLGSKPATASMR